MVLRRHKSPGFTLVELVVSMAVGALVVVTICSLFVQFATTSATLVHYTVVNSNDRQSLETIGRDIREADSFVKLTKTDLMLLNSNQPVQLLFKPSERRLYRNTLKTNEVILPNCDALQFTFYQRNASGEDFNDLLVSTSSACRVVEMKWNSTIVSNRSTISTVTNVVRFLNRRVTAN